MIDFIPLKYYAPIYFFLLLLLTLFVWINSRSYTLTDVVNQDRLARIGKVLILFSCLYIGLRPIDGIYFGDTITYAQTFEKYQRNIFTEAKDSEKVFQFLMSNFAKITSVNIFLLFCGCLYIIPLYLACKKMFKTYWFLPFFMLVISLSFWAYGVNGVRNGIATSLFIYALSLDSLPLQIAFFFLGLGFHQSLLLPIVGFVLTKINNNSKFYLLFWLLCIPISLVAGNLFSGFFAGYFENDKLNAYLIEENTEDHFSHVGFRWDFLLYSMTAVYAVWYFVFKKKFEDVLYNRIANIYLFANGVWVLVIRSNFSNRFAYLSWFLLGLVIVYPFLKQQFFKDQYIVLSTVIFFYFMFTFFLDVVL